jgi:spore germination cell wall hydrolase CwlJ-like protein
VEGHAVTDPIHLLRHFAVALCVWREARGQSPLGKVLVAQVIENRVADARWPDTYIGAITQPWQFSAFNKNDPNTTKFPEEDDPTWADAVAAADYVLTAPSPITDANHYHTRGVRPTWAQGQTPLVTEGQHLFYQL